MKILKHTTLNWSRIFY